MGERVAIRGCDNYRLEAVKGAVTAALRDVMGTEGEGNPLEGLVKPGDNVFIKPNWVASRWRASCPHKDSLYCVITHPAVIESVTDLVADALKGRGAMIIGDNPSIDADFEELMEFTGIRRLGGKYDVPVRILDLRPLVCKDLRDYGKRDKMAAQPGDPAGTMEVNLGKDSLLYGIDSSRFRGVFNEREGTRLAHTGETQLYTYSRSLYDSNVYISIPKLKTHQKVGATLNLKGLVGSIADKNQLVHWRVGYPEVGGDEYPDQASWEASLTAKVTHRGAWPGNDTIWRMVVDLYHGLMKRPRRTLSVIDGVVGGEGQGPFCPTSKFSCCVIAGKSLLATDVVAARYMGLNPLKIAYLGYLLEHGEISLNEICPLLEGKIASEFFNAATSYKDFSTTRAWEAIHWNPCERV